MSSEQTHKTIILSAEKIAEKPIELLPPIKALETKEELEEHMDE
jgi:hypothetical protein